jgi:hypothetical protein
MFLETINQKRQREMREFERRNALDIRRQFWQRKEAESERD